jgi:hypothetical protein
MQEFGVEKSKMKNFSFSHCVEALRKLENPEYKKGDMSLTKEIEVVEPIFVEYDKNASEFED